MPYEFIPVVLGITFIFGLLAFGLVRSFFVTQNRLKLREMVHQERLKAIDKEAPLSDLTYDDRLAADLGAGNARSNATAILWLRLTALCVGLAGGLGGVGMIVAFATSGDRGLQEIWSIGLIPVMVGIGLILFYLLTRQVAPDPEESA